MKHIEIYTDGACSGNPGPGGWGAILRFRTAQKVYEKELSGWKKADKSPALNPDLWAPLLAESEKHEITYHWLKGHAGHPENERCDRMAVEQSKKYGGRQA